MNPSDHDQMLYDTAANLPWSETPSHSYHACATCHHLWSALTEHLRTHESDQHLSSSTTCYPPFDSSLFVLPEDFPAHSSSAPSTLPSTQLSSSNSGTTTPAFPPPSQSTNFHRPSRSISRPGANIPTLSSSFSSTHYHANTSVPSSTDPSPFPSPQSAISFSSQQDPAMDYDRLVPARSRASSMQSLRKRPRPKAPDYGDMRKIRACEECRRLKRKCDPAHPGPRVPWAESDYRKVDE